jgi:pimeloyl-ACP methyl ester carboxylesterase
VTTSHDGLRLATRQVGTDPRFLLVHANGFCKETWDPFIEELGGADFVSFDQRGHGDSETPPVPIDWWDLGRDVLSVLDAAALSTSLTGVGHSSGGAAVAIAEILRPGTFSRLVLIEPIILPPPFQRHDDSPMAVLAERRRVAFESAEAAGASYRDRAPFRSWDPRALHAYVTHGFEARAGGWALKCAPSTEAEIYRSAFAHGAWDRLDEVGCEVHLVFGSQSQAVSAPHAREMLQQFSHGHLHEIADADHLIPMECPEVLAAVVAGI